MASGDLYAAQPGAMNICPWSLGPWQLVGNVFVNGGGGTGPVVGMDENGQVMCASGDWFQLGISVNACSGFSATFLGNVFAITGARAPGETVAAFGGNGGAQYAVTNLGSVFRWLGCNGTWERHGSLNTGPTATSRRSWGELKVLYR
jgi:hypothetical protein